MGTGQKTIRTILVVALALTLFGSTTAAFAGGSPAGDQYGGQGTQGTATPQNQGTAGQQTQTGGTLPFTGTSLLVTLVGGLALIGAGVLIHRSGRRADN